MWVSPNNNKYPGKRSSHCSAIFLMQAAIKKLDEEISSSGGWKNKEHEHNKLKIE